MASTFKARFGFLLGSEPFWWGVCLFCAGISAWYERHSMNPDGLNYLDLASEAVSGGPTALVNGYWSPGYPALLSVALFLFRPSPAQEFPLIHFINFLIFIFALWSFSVFFRYGFVALLGDEVVNKSKRRYLTPFAFSTFLWFTLTFIGIGLVTPDLGVAAIVFLAAGISCRLSLPRSSWIHYVALGLVLAIGYYLKAAMFPLGLTLLAFLFLFNSASRQKLVLSLSVFLLVATPLVAALSARTNALTFGETGRLNYLWFVNGVQYSGWTGGSNDLYGSPEHPPRKLSEKPLIIEFGSPIKGTYPLGYDRSYWYAGAKPRFDLRQQVETLAVTLRDYKVIFSDTIAFVAGALVLYALIIRRKLVPAIPRGSWWQVAWPLAACSMYAPVHVEPRFLGAYFVLFWLTIYRAVMFRVTRCVTLAVCAIVLCALMIPFAAGMAVAVVRIAVDLVDPGPPEYQKVALGLQDLGLHNGDSLAVVGEAYNHYYARFARLRVVVEIPDPHEFWHLSTPELESVAERLALIGVKAVVASTRPDTSVSAYWNDIKVSDSVRFSVMLLPLQVNH